MTDFDLDRAYTALSDSLAHVGEKGAPLFLSMVCLALMSRFERADDVLHVIDLARRQAATGSTSEAGDAA
jgi:hypothetical protein